MARTMGVAEATIVNGTLVADTTQALTVGSRRQATAGTAYQFELVATSEEERNAASSTFDSSVSSGSIEVASAASVLAEDC
eukprot:CAMPEP_0174838994 /NCGR_PEP_ID=MMETSP1114-20130205/7765_1 /TAXON_ID=312471 /ORGANISM="Neobodo designis, Strain CCAP 1951/1" /LENGTH=80 /DNA_ID=CAMNT_0016073113 /DNA_START=1 /DNA_END=240 /DNA_ORIENTATION=+